MSKEVVIMIVQRCEGACTCPVDGSGDGVVQSMGHRQAIIPKRGRPP